MKTRLFAAKSESGSTLMVVLMLIATTSLMIAAVFMMTTGEARLMKRSIDRDTAIAYGDGVLDDLFDQWRSAMTNSSMTATQKRNGPTGAQLTGTGSGNFGITITTTGSSSIHVPPTNMSLTSWGLVAGTPYGTALASGSSPTLENGSNSSLLIRMYYVATATVSFPHGSVTVQRIFTRAGTNIFNNFLYSSQPVTELDPGATMSVNGTIYAGGNLYLDNSNLTLLQDVSYTGSMATTLAPGNNEGAPSGTPTWPSSDPPHLGVSQNLIDVVTSELDQNFVSSGGYYDPGVYSTTNSVTQDVNDKGYHELIEQASSGTQADPLQLDTASGTATADNERLASNADYRIFVDGSNNVTIYKGSTQLTSGAEYNAILGALTTNTAFYDGRVGDTVRAITVDVGKITTAYNAGTIKDNNTFEGATANDGLLLYIQDTSAVNATITGSSATVSGSAVTTNNYNYNIVASGTNGLHTTALSGTSSHVTSSFARGVRLVNGGSLPASNSTNVTGGLTIASPNPVYVQGDYNTGSTYSGSFSSSGMTYSNTPSSDGTNAYPSGTSTPAWTSGSYTEQTSVIAADAVTILSNGWSDSTSNSSLSSRTPLNTTINSAIVAGNVPTAFVVSHFNVSTDYSGGIENFPRLLENWSGYNLTIHGSFALLYNSEQAVQPWQPTGNYYNAPNRRWFFDTTLQNYNPPGFPAAYTYTRGRWMTK
ncbi:MAG TPA: hypothetical protein VG733_06445 [Chthoniobacteraceae bacterium]|nr:hypothetical protein [Chthoniobacteraceae bacterium]